MKNTLYTQFSNKQVINCKDGKILGYTIDLKFDQEKGSICSFFVRENNRLCFWSKTPTIEIFWEKISKIGDDIILVDLDFFQPDFEKKDKRDKKHFF